MRSLALALASVAACSGAPDPASTPRAAQAVSLVAPARGSDDVVVAQVNGRPVWGSCVAAQLQRMPAATRDGALRECVDFELLAQAAETRGLAAQAEVTDETRRALVSRLVETGFEDRHRSP